MFKIISSDFMMFRLNEGVKSEFRFYCSCTTHSFPPISVNNKNKWKYRCFVSCYLGQWRELVNTCVSAFWVGNVWTVKRLHECLLSLYLLLAAVLLLHRHHRPLFLLLLSFFPWCSRLLIAVLAADVADGQLSSRAGRQSVPLLLLPRWPPQLLVGVGRRAAGKDGHSQTELTSLRARTDERSHSPQQADFELQGAEDLADAVRVRQQVAGVWDLGGVDFGVVLLHTRQAKHVTGFQQVGLRPETLSTPPTWTNEDYRWKQDERRSTSTTQEPTGEAAGFWKRLQPELWSSYRRSLTHSLRHKVTWLCYNTNTHFDFQCHI